ncbi:hypothetical protein D3C84_600180 [compost metagenome]
MPGAHPFPPPSVFILSSAVRHHPPLDFLEPGRRGVLSSAPSPPGIISSGIIPSGIQSAMPPPMSSFFSLPNTQPPPNFVLPNSAAKPAIAVPGFSSAKLPTSSTPLVSRSVIGLKFSVKSPTALSNFETVTLQLLESRSMELRLFLTPSASFP